MAQVSGLFHVNGRVGNLTFYTRNGKTCVRLRGNGVSRSRIKYDPRMSHVRRNMSRFKGLAAGAKSFSSAIAALRDFRDSSMHSRAVSLFSRIAKATDAHSSQPPLLVSQHKRLLKGFQLNKKLEFEKLCVLSEESARCTPQCVGGELTVMHCTREMFPTATHFRLVRALVVLSDTIFDKRIGKYVSVSPDIDGKHAVSRSGFIAFDKDRYDVTLRTILPVESIPPSATVLELLGIEFFQKVNDDYLPFTKAKAMKIVHAF